MADNDWIGKVVGVASLLATLVLAWGAYRAAGREQERRKRDRTD